MRSQLPWSLRWLAILPAARWLGAFASEASAPAYRNERCPSGGVYNEFGGSGACYFVSTTEHTFESCQADVCGPRNATLACMQYSGLYMMGLGDGLGEDFFGAWIGYTKAGSHKSDPREGWYWINECEETWVNWLPGEPDNYCGGEDCAAVTPFGYWMEVSCRFRLPCLCQYPSQVGMRYQYHRPALRDDTCYADCGDLTKWCSAWPFMGLSDVDDDVCDWEEKDGQRRGRGVSSCAKMVAEDPACGQYFSYALGSCRCTPATGLHLNCTHREKDPTRDVFVIQAEGTRLVYAGQRCVYGLDVAPEVFAQLKPGGTWGDFTHRWFRVAAVWLTFGLPCGFVMAYVLLRMAGRRCTSEGVVRSGEEASRGASVGDRAAYGPLLEDAPEESIDVGDSVNRWIFRGAVGNIIYGAALLSLGFTLGTAVAGGSDSESLSKELLETLIMAVSKAATGRAAHMLHMRLSPMARQIAGPWLLVVALAKLTMALTALGGTFIFGSLADGDYENVCFALWLFRWSLLLALPFQCISGFALWRVQVRATTYAGGASRADGWAALLIIGDFGAGAGVWWAGYLNCVHEVGDLTLAACFVNAALSQLLAGVSLLCINWKVRQYFKDQAVSQLASRSTVAAEPVGRQLESGGLGDVVVGRPVASSSA